MNNSYMITIQFDTDSEPSREQCDMFLKAMETLVRDIFRGVCVTGAVKVEAGAPQQSLFRLFEEGSKWAD